jgi:NADH dehydrogenase (ubiquinone) Fe-S protein 4
MSQMWRVQFEKVPGGDDRWTNPLMGWTSTADPLSNLGLAFPTKEAAVDYSKRNGYAYTVFEPEAAKPAVRKIAAYGRSMVHHWDHDGLPVYEDESAIKK